MEVCNIRSYDGGTFDLVVLYEKISSNWVIANSITFVVINSGDKCKVGIALDNIQFFSSWLD